MLRDLGEWMYRLQHRETPSPPIRDENIIYVYDPVAPENQDRERLRAILIYGMRGESETLDFDADRTGRKGWPVEKVPGALEAIFVSKFGPEPQGRSYITGEPLPPSDEA